MSLIGLHIGSTGCNAVVFSENGTVLGEGSGECSIRKPQAGWMEQDAERVWQIAWQSLEDALDRAGRDDPPKAMALSVWGNTVIPIDRSGYSLRYAIHDEDVRAEAETNWLVEELGAEFFSSRSGAPLQASDALCKILWIQKNEPGLWAKTDRFLFYEDLFLNRFCGNPAVSHSLASRSQLYDPSKNDWADDVLNKCGIERNKLAPLASLEGGVVGSMRPPLSHELGIHHEMPLTSGGLGGACMEIGRSAGCVSESNAACLGAAILAGVTVGVYTDVSKGVSIVNG